MTKRLPAPRPRRPRRLPAQQWAAHRRVTSGLSAADRALFGRVAAHRPLLDPTLPRLSHAADHGLLWWGIAAALGATGGNRRRAALRGLFALAGASAVANGPGKLIFRRDRPTVEVPLPRRLRRELGSFSFPSGHSASAAAFATAVALDAPAAAVPVGLVAGAVGYSRVYVGVHYPGDVIAGALLGAGVAALTTRVMPRRPITPARARPASAWAPALPDGDGLVMVVNARAGGRHLAVADAVRSALPAAEIVMIGADQADQADHPREPALTGPGSGTLGRIVAGPGGSEPDRPGDDLTGALRAAAGRARVLGIAGGDGTVNAAAAVALEAKLPLAIAPAGTLNHFAGDLGVMTVDDLIMAVRDGTAVAVDVGRIDAVDDEGEPTSAIFLNTASLVGYPEMVLIRERFERRIGKWPAMILALTRVLRDQPPTRLEIDGRMRRLWLVFVGNGRYSPDGFAPTYRDRLDSGLLDVRLVDATSPLSRTRLVLAVLTGLLGRSRVYQELAAHSVRITAPDGPLPYAKDGEVGETVTRVTVFKNPDRLVVYRPAG